MNQLDEYAIQTKGIPQFVLMERAAEAVCNSLLEFMPYQKVLVVAGIGNCAGDGIAAARILKNRGFAPVVWLVKPLEKCRESVHKQLEPYQNAGGIVINEKPVLEFDLIIDAIFGVGLNRDLDEDFINAVEFINAAKEDGKHVVSVDLPSGIHTDTGAIMGAAVRADLTVSFSYIKPGLLMYPGREYAGKVKIASIGIDDEEYLNAIGIPQNGQRFVYPGNCEFIKDISGKEPKEKNPKLKRRNPSGNKGTFHRVLLVAGSKDMGGAALLAAESALRSGCGLVDVFTHEVNRDLILRSLPEAIVHTYGSNTDHSNEPAQNDYSALPEALQAIARNGEQSHANAEDGGFNRKLQMDLKNAINAADTVVVGPGLSMCKEAICIVETILSVCDKPLIVDADAINIISKFDLKNALKEHASKSLTIMTPHPGELARLTGLHTKDILADYENILVNTAKEYNVILVGKGNPTIVTDGKDIYYNLSGNDAMATAGSGDVLSGMLGAFLLNENTPFEGTTLAVYAHGLSGEEASKELGHHSVIAGDLIKYLHKALIILSMLFLCTTLFGCTKMKQQNNPTRKEELDNFLGNNSFHGLFLATYDINHALNNKLQSDLGVNTYIALHYHPANEEDLFEALDYIDKNNKNGNYEYLFLGLDPMLMHANAKGLARKITKHGFNKYAIFLPAFPMKYWTSMDVNLREETMQAYIDFVKEFDGVSNVTVYFFGNEPWLVYNPGNYLNGTYQLTDYASERVVLYTMCNADYIVDQNNIEEEMNKLKNVVEGYIGVEADLTEKELGGEAFVFFGDSIFGLYQTPASIPAVFETYTGAESMNLGCGGMNMTYRDGGDCFRILFDEVLNKNHNHFEGPALELINEYSAPENKADFDDAKFIFNNKDYDKYDKVSVILEFGLNDYFNGYSVEEFKNNYKETLDRLQKFMKEDHRFADIYLVVPGANDIDYMDYGYMKNSNVGGTLQEYCEAIVELGEEYGIGVIDLRKDPVLNQDNIAKYLYADATHYNEAGRLEVATYMAKEIAKLR